MKTTESVKIAKKYHWRKYQCSKCNSIVETDIEDRYCKKCKNKLIEVK